MDRTDRPSRPYTTGLLPRPSSMTTLTLIRTVTTSNICIVYLVNFTDISNG
jgi:hypothetical protein